MKKIYTYKDGSKAIFENDNKVVFSKDEYNALIAAEIPFNALPPTTTALYDYIECKVQKNKWCQAAFSAILEYYRKHEFSTKEFELNEIKGALVFEDNNPIIIQANPPEGQSIAVGDRDWDGALEFLKENNIF